MHSAEIFHYQDAAKLYQFEKPYSSGGDAEQVGVPFSGLVVSFLLALKHLGAGRTSVCSADA